MSLDRYSNKEQIINTDGEVRGLEWRADDIELLQLDIKNIFPSEKPEVEIHLYVPGEDTRYITGGYTDDFHLEKDQIYVDYAAAIKDLGIDRGQFEVVVNVQKSLLGSADDKQLWIKEISDDRRELHIKMIPSGDLDIQTYLDSFGQGVYEQKVYETKINGDGVEELVRDENKQLILKDIIERPLSDDISINFGENRLYKILNQKDWEEENDFVVRLYNPLPDDITEKTKLWIVEELSDSIIDNVDVTGILPPDEQRNVLLGPNFNVESSYSTITETNFETWNSLLDEGLSTSQQVVDRMFSGSLAGVPIGIQYDSFDNFIHFSSAKERVSNFKSKLELVEYYNERIDILNGTSGSDTSALQGNIATATRRKNDVIGSFDGFEKWCYNEGTSSLFTHGTTGSFIGADGYTISPYPKYIQSGKYVLHHSTSSIAEDWYNGLISTGSLYDESNDNALAKTIPEHIRLDSNNDQYELFINMIGHHYDIIYSYIDNLHKVYKTQEHPKLGQSKEVLYQIAESLGWSLTNGKQATALTQYKLGVDSGSGAFAQTGSIFSKSDEDITTDIWRRIVNNLPYLLKTKGTARSIKALMNTYGIPQTLLSIREYGGPQVEEDKPALIEDRFSYALQFKSGSIGAGGNPITSPHIMIKMRDYTTNIGMWGYQRPGLSSGDDIPPQTKEWRFKPAVKANMLLLTNSNLMADGSERVRFQLGIEHTASYSGSSNYGRLISSHVRAGRAGGNEPGTGSSEWVPLFDGNFWNIRWYWQQTGSGVAGSYNEKDGTGYTYHIETQQASDYITGKIVHSASISYTPVSHIHRTGWIGSQNNATTVKSYLGGHPGLGASRDNLNVNKQFRRNMISDNSYNGSDVEIMTFSGSMQEYREWLEDIGDDTFDFHTLNPTSYVSGKSPSSSFDTLVRHYPLGTDLNARDHGPATGHAGTIISSSHPAQTVLDAQLPYDTTTANLLDSGSSYASMSYFSNEPTSDRGNYEPVEETYYIQGVSLGGNVPRSQKIRLEENSIQRALTPNTTAERSSFDRAPIDTNRLGLFYSSADQVNKEIFNHVGDVALDDFVGNPESEFEFEYDQLNDFAKEYWKKYTDKNDINAYSRIFSQFDFALFQQIKQVLPERVDENMGLLIEPHALERVKARLTKRPVITNPQFEVTIDDKEPETSGSILLLTSSISAMKPLKAFTSGYHGVSGSGGFLDTGNYIARISGSNPSPLESVDYFTIDIPPIDEALFVSSSAIAVYSMIPRELDQPYGSPTSSRWGAYEMALGDPNVNEIFFATGNYLKATVTSSANSSFVADTTDKLVIQYDTYSNFSTVRDFNFRLASKDSDVSGKVDVFVQLFTTVDNQHGSYLENYQQNWSSLNSFLVSESAIRVDRVISEQTETVTYVSNTARHDKYSFSNINIPPRTNLSFAIQFKKSSLSPTNGTAEPSIDQIHMTQRIQKTGHSIIQEVIETPRPSTIFKEQVLHFSGSNTIGNKWKRNFDFVVSESLGFGYHYSESFGTTGYRDDKFQMTENQRYEGCKLVGPGINMASTIRAIDNKPVIEIFSVNPNQLIYKDQPEENSSGNLLVR